MMNLPKRLVVAGLSTSLVLLGGTGTVFAAQAEAADDVKEITIWEYFQDNEHEYFSNMMNEWGDENGYKFTIVQYPYADLNKQYTLGLVSGELPDIAMINNCDNESFVNMGLLEDITAKVQEENLSDSFYQSSMNTTTIDGKIYGLPYNSNDLVLFYDKDQFAEAGVDAENLKSLADLKDAAAKLTKDNTYGFSMSLISTDEGTFQFFPFLYGSGADMYNMGSDEAISVMQFLKDMYDEGYMASEVINQGQVDINEQFVQGNVAMMINGPWEIPIINEEAPDKNWGVMGIPYDKQPASALGGEGFSIVKGANIDDTWPVMMHMFDKDVLADWCHAVGKIPSRSDSVENYADWSEDPIMQVFFEQFEYAATLGPDAKWPEISKSIYTACQAALTGQLSVEEACQTSQAEIDELTK